MTSPTKRTGDEAEIRALIERWAAALRAKDARGVLACGGDDFVHFSLAPPLRADLEAAGLDAWFATWRGPLGYELRELRVAAADDVAFGHGFGHLTGAKLDGEQVDLWFRITFAFRKLQDGWKLVHGHESVPFCMDGSFKAAVDLKP